MITNHTPIPKFFEWNDPPGNMLKMMHLHIHVKVHFVGYRLVQVKIWILHPLVSHSSRSKYVRRCWILALQKYSKQKKKKKHLSPVNIQRPTCLFRCMTFLLFAPNTGFISSNAVRIGWCRGEITRDATSLFSSTITYNAENCRPST